MSRSRPSHRQPSRLPAWWLFPTVLILTGGLVLWSRSANPEPQSLGRTYPNQGQTHIAPGAAHPAYNSFPATSGWHEATPAPWGVSSKALPQEQLVHNLEHGGIVMQYNPNTIHDISVLLSIQKQYPNKTVVAPNAKLDVPLAVTAWRQLYTLQGPDETQLLTFVRQYKDRAPERFPD